MSATPVLDPKVRDLKARVHQLELDVGVLKEELEAVIESQRVVCDHCLHEQPPPSEDVPRCERCDSWLLEKTYV